MKLIAVAAVLVAIVAACDRGRVVHPASVASVTPSTTSTPPTANTNAEEVVQWEYVTFAPPDEVYDETLNRLGKEGWELVTARRVRSEGSMAYEVTMRRRVQQGRPGTTAEEQMRIARAAARRMRGEIAVTVTAPSSAAPMPEQKHLQQTEILVVSHEPRSETVYDDVYVDAERREFHVAGCPNATRYPLKLHFAVVRTQAIGRAHDCASLPLGSHERHWIEPIRKTIKRDLSDVSFAKPVENQSEPWYVDDARRVAFHGSPCVAGNIHATRKVTWRDLWSTEYAMYELCEPLQ